MITLYLKSGDFPFTIDLVQLSNFKGNRKFTFIAIRKRSLGVN